MAITRRSVLRGAAGSLLLARGLPAPAAAAQPAAVEEAAPRGYVQLSADLLGVAPERLEPAGGGAPPTLADAFHAQCRAAAPAALDALLAAHDRARRAGATPAAAAQALLTAGGRPRPDGVGALARLTMLMWLSGVWYGATEAARMPSSAALLAPAARRDFVVSVRAYRNGWIWRLAQARPAGVAGRPGEWTAPPPPLDEFLAGARG